MVLDICEKCGYVDHKKTCKDIKVMVVDGSLSADEIAKLISELSSDSGGEFVVTDKTNYDIVMEVFKEIAQDKNQTPQDRMDACKLLLEYDC